MTLLWAVAPVSVALAIGVVLQQLRLMGDASVQLAAELHRLDEVRVAVATVRAESAQARAAVHSLRGELRAR
jgi:hypothetical protein